MSGVRVRAGRLLPIGAPSACAAIVRRVTSLPDAGTRLRCGGCGNLTRFDVTRTRRTQEFWHFDLAGDHRVEEIEVLGEDVETLTCRWCGRSDAIELVSRNDADLATDPS